MSTHSYKCISCGAPIAYNADLGRFKCEYCGSEYEERELSEFWKKIKETIKKKSPPKNQDVSYHGYICNNCGASVVTDLETTSTFCYYCHSPVILTGKFGGDFMPDKIIPFSISRQKAIEIFGKWLEGKRFVPKDFGGKNHLDKMTGIYVPHWEIDARFNMDYEAKAFNRSSWTTGDRTYTNTKIYSVVRKGNLTLNNITQSGTDRFDNNLIDGITPYDVDSAVSFSPGYLSGFFAENYTLDKESVKADVQKNAYEYSERVVRDDITGYGEVNTLKNNLIVQEQNWYYTLYPLWILTYNYMDKIYTFAINGQTGKSFGGLPLEEKRLNISGFIIFAIIFALLLAGGYFIW